MYYFVFPEKKRKVEILRTCFEINFILRGGFRNITISGNKFLSAN